MNQNYKIIPGSESISLQGNKYGILMLHGFTGSPTQMRPLVDFLAPQNYSIEVPLLRGHGTSEKDLAHCEWYDWFADAKEALINLRKTRKKIIVIGFSSGATLALHLAAHYQVEGLVALAPALILKQPLAKLAPYVQPIFKYWKKSKKADLFDMTDQDKIISYPRNPVRAVSELLKMFEHVKMDMPEIYTPILIIQSQDDHVVDRDGAQWIYDHISTESKQILWLEKSYHVITYDIEKEIVFRETQNFIKTIF